MEVRTILVNVDIDAFSPALVHCAAGLAGRFGAGLIGIGAADVSATVAAYQGAVFAPEIFDEERRDIQAQLSVLEKRFRAELPAGMRAEWRGFIEAPKVAVARTARCADLIVTASNFNTPRRNPMRTIDTGELLVDAGRPVLIAGIGAAEIRANAIVVGWKDSREARRATAEALPLLKAARDVVVATINEGNEAVEKASLDDLLAWLRSHDISARGGIFPPTAGGPAETLESIAQESGADLVVTGGYGHGRVREWLFGGMTRDLLADRAVNRFMSN